MDLHSQSTSRVSLHDMRQHQSVTRKQDNDNIQFTGRIMIVDDEDDINLTLKVVLEDIGFKVDSFSQPVMALKNFENGLYDLVILDVRMPVLNGFGLYVEIRKLDDKVKICFLTAASDLYYEAFRKDAFSNIDENIIIHKPIENEFLIK